MNQLAILKDKLSRDPLFCALFNKADGTQEAIRVASAFGICLSFEDVITFRKELRSIIGKQSFQLNFARPEKLSSDWSGWGADTWIAGEGGSGCAGHEHGGVCSHY